MSSLLQSVRENAVFVLEFFGIIVGFFLLAFILEKISKKKQDGKEEKILTTRKMSVIGMFSAIAAVLMLFEIVLFFIPGFYKLDFSELPILIGTFAFGPVAGILMEFLKILLKVFIKGTGTAFVGELANFVVGCSFILPASVVYMIRKNKKNAIVACVVGTLVMTVFGSIFNAIYLLPAFAEMMAGQTVDDFIRMGAEVNVFVKEGNMTSFILACVVPMNLIKGVSVSVITLLVYKRLSPIIKSSHKM